MTVMPLAMIRRRRAIDHHHDSSQYWHAESSRRQPSRIRRSSLRHHGISDISRPSWCHGILMVVQVSSGPYSPRRSRGLRAHGDSALLVPWLVRWEISGKQARTYYAGVAPSSANSYDIISYYLYFDALYALFAIIYYTFFYYCQYLLAVFRLLFPIFPCPPKKKFILILSFLSFSLFFWPSIIWINAIILLLFQLFSSCIIFIICFGM
jgi:hypothetical protein